MTKLLQRFYHIPSGLKYDVSILTNADMKNQAFALLYRKYIEEAKVPWNFPIKNPSNIRVEERTVDGRIDVPVLVDDFEHTAILGGIICPEGKVVGTGRLLHRDMMPSGVLEIELYDALPRKSRAMIKETNCNLELSRNAVDDCLKGKHISLLPFYALLSEYYAKDYWVAARDHFVFTMPKTVSDKRGWGLEHCSVVSKVDDSFKYAQDDPEPVGIYLVPYNKFEVYFYGIFYRANARIIPIPATDSFLHLVLAYTGRHNHSHL